MGEIYIIRKVTIDGIAHYVDPWLTDNDRTWCGMTIQPFVFAGWHPTAQECPDCMKKKEEEVQRVSKLRR